HRTSSKGAILAMTRALARVRGPAGRFRIKRRSQAARDATVCRAAAEVPPIAACETITAETFSMRSIFTLCAMKYSALNGFSAITPRAAPRPPREPGINDNWGRRPASLAAPWPARLVVALGTGQPRAVRPRAGMIVETFLFVL